MDTDLQARIERLYENESLTDNLTDANAKILLKWAEEQLRANTDDTLVAAALSAANASDATESDALLAQAQSFLTQQLRAAENRAAPEISAARPATLNDAAPAQTQPASSGSTPTLEASGAVGPAIVSDAHVSANGSAALQPNKKSRRARKTKK